MLKTKFGFFRAGLMAVLMCLALALPAAALAQSASGSAAPASPAQTASAPAGAATGASASAAASGAASAAPATTSASGAPAGTAASAAAGGAASPAASPAGVATPIGSNPATAGESQEPISYFAYLLIILAAIWFLAAIGGIVRLLMRPSTGPYAIPLPPDESDRHFLTFVLPFAALLAVAIIVVGFGVLFLALSTQSEQYPLAVDLFIVCLVMFIATILALRVRPGTSSAVE